jgi:hypothetical protein
MTIEQLIEALRQFPQNATIKCGLSVPDIYINSVANLSISGDHEDASKCTNVRLVCTAPPRAQYANPNPSGPVQES